MSSRPLHPRFLAGAIAGALSIGLASTASAQDLSVSSDSFNPTTTAGSSYLEVHNGSQLGQGEYQVSVLGRYANDPLVLVDEDGDDNVADAVESSMQMNVLAGVGIIDVLQVGADFPVELYQRNGGFESTDEFGEDESADLGNIRLMPEAQLFSSIDDANDRGVQVGLTADLTLPTSTEANDLTVDTPSLEPAVVFEGAFSRTGSLALNAGYLYHSDERVQGLELSDAVTWGAGLQLDVLPRLAVIPEMSGQIETRDTNALDLEESPLEGQLGVAVQASDVIAVRASAGASFTEAFDTPDFQSVVGLTLTAPDSRPDDDDMDGIYTMDDACPQIAEDIDGFDDGDGCPDPDNDNDSIADADDACPMTAEDMDAYRDEDGCPDTDNDNDTIADINDACPNVAEDIDGRDDLDGCPDVDNDRDGIADASDLCAEDAEDFDGFEDTDGCPDLDNDNDGRLDVADACINEPEDVDGREDGDGCPEPGEGPVRVTCSQIEIRQDVEFAVDSADIRERSYELLNTVAAVIMSDEDLGEIRVEGHTDDTGPADYNQQLSQDRAASVVDYLVSQGVSRDRLRAVGVGEQAPIATNSTEEGRSENRRVEFDIIEPPVACQTASN